MKSNLNFKEISGEKFNSEFKKLFLLQFTQELINNSMPREVFKLENIIQDEEKTKKNETKEKIKEIVNDKEMEKSILSEKREIRNFHSPPRLIKRKSFPVPDPFKKLKLIIPETRFPAHLQYLKPLPVPEEIDLDKVNPLIKDPYVRTIECNGPNQNLIVKGSMGIKKTGIVLDKNEIKEVIQKISKATKIPAQEGIFKVAVGKIMFLAIISEIIGSKFIIRKMFYKTNEKPNYSRKT